MVLFGSLVATASAQPASGPVDVTRLLPSSFYLVTRMCKQSVIEIGNGPIILQDIGGGNAIYLNASSGDAVTVSRQYIARDGVTRAFVKTCKAMLLNEQQFEMLAKAGEKQGPPPAR